MSGWGAVILFSAACILALSGYVLFGMPAVGYVVMGMALYVLGWAWTIIYPELREDWRREMLWRRKSKGTLKWSNK